MPQPESDDRHAEFADYAGEQFFAFAEHWDEREWPNEPLEYRNLQGYLSAWLEHGEGVEVAGGKFENWLKIIIHIADAAMRAPDLLYYRDSEPQRERSIDGILADDAYGLYHDVLDKQYFDATVYKRSQRPPDRSS